MSSLIFAPMLALSAALASLLVNRARAGSDYLRFAAVLYLALAASVEARFLLSGVSAAILMTAVTQVVAAMAPVSLALSLFAAFEQSPSPLAASALLVLACLAGIASAAMGLPAVAYAILAASVCVMLALSLRRWRSDTRSAAHAFFAVCALVCAAAAAQTKGSEAALALFLSASVLGFALALMHSGAAVAKQRHSRAGSVAISRKR
jgi:hypothetical protein